MQGRLRQGPALIFSLLFATRRCTNLETIEPTPCDSEESSLLQIGTTKIEKAVGSDVPVDSIHARGWNLPGNKDLTPDQYTLSQPATNFGLTPSNALLDGGGPERKLFPEGKVPLELAGDAGPELIQANDPGDTCSGGDIVGYSILNVSSPTLVPFEVPNSKIGNKSIAVIVAPGGGLRFLSWNKEGTRIAKWLNSINISAFVLKYRVPTSSLQTASKVFADGQRAVSLLRSPEYGYNKIGMIGFSAGGEVCTGVASTSARVYDPIDEIDRFSNKLDFVLGIYPATHPQIPEHPVPTFLALAADDPCVSPSLVASYFGKLSEKTGKHELHIFSGGKHGYGDCSMFVNGNLWQTVCGWPDKATAWMMNLFEEAQTWPPPH